MPFAMVRARKAFIKERGSRRPRPPVDPGRPGLGSARKLASLSAASGSERRGGRAGRKAAADALGLNCSQSAKLQIFPE
jgi:hypothetical protein